MRHEKYTLNYNQLLTRDLLPEPGEQGQTRRIVSSNLHCSATDINVLLVIKQIKHQKQNVFKKPKDSGGSKQLCGYDI